MLIHEGDMVVCYFKDKGAKLIRVRENGEMNTKHGKLSYSRMIGRPYGATITTSISHPVYLLRPTAEDLAMGVRRISNINYPKDISRILYRIGIRPGARVVEIGAGSGAMAISLAYAVGTEGCVYTYDIREDMLKCTGKNLRRVGLADRVTLKLRDKKEPLSETQVDAVLMDIPTPWEELDASWEALCCGGYLACTVPTYDQLGELAICLSKKSFMPLEAMEIMCRPLRAERGRTRPEFKMITHTQMIQFAVKILPLAASETTAEDNYGLGANDDENA